MAEEKGDASKIPEQITLIIAGIAFVLVVVMGALGCIGGYFDVFNSCGAGGASLMLQTSGLFLTYIAGAVTFLTEGLIINFGSIVGGNNFAAGIAIVWTIIRDLMNLVFIGGLIYAAFALILQLTVFGERVGKLIAMILIAALLVNFSYFIAGAIVDASNFTTKIIYEQIFPEVEPAGSGQFAAIQHRFETGGSFTGKVMSLLGLQTVYNPNDDNGNPLGLEFSFKGNGLLLWYGFMASMFILATAYSFFQVAKLFLVRFIAVVYLLIMSPFAIVYFTGIPVIKAWGGAWWKTMAAQAIFPPVYFILLGISLSLISAMQVVFEYDEAGVGQNFALALSGDLTGTQSFSSFIGTSMFFAIAIGFIIMAARIAENISKEVEVKPWNSQTLYKAPGVAIGAALKFATQAVAPATRLPGRIPVLREIGEKTGLLGRGSGKTPIRDGVGELFRAPRTPQSEYQKGKRDLNKNRILKLAGKDWDSSPEKSKDELYTRVTNLDEDEKASLLSEATRGQRGNMLKAENHIPAREGAGGALGGGAKEVRIPTRDELNTAKKAVNDGSAFKAMQEEMRKGNQLSEEMLRMFRIMSIRDRKALLQNAAKAGSGDNLTSLLSALNGVSDKTETISGLKPEVLVQPEFAPHIDNRVINKLDERQKNGEIEKNDLEEIKQNVRYTPRGTATKVRPVTSDEEEV